MSKPVALDLEQGHTLLLKGPAWIRAKRGDAQCLGARIQSDIGPPTTISSSVVQAPIIGLHKAAAEISFFIGDTSPSFVPGKVVALATRLKKRMTSSADTVLVNTDGWLTEFNALRHKQLLLEEIQPDLVIGLSR